MLSEASSWRLERPDWVDVNISISMKVIKKNAFNEVDENLTNS